MHDSIKRTSHAADRKRRAVVLTLLAALAAPVAAAPKTPRPSQDPASARTAASGAATRTAILAGGCFWTLQQVFDRVDGVTFTTTGFIGGTLRNPTYEQVTSGRTGHMEAVKIAFDPARVSFAQLLDIYWRNIDPTRVDQQFCDIGRQYNATVFYLDESQRLTAEASRAALERSKPFSARIRTPVMPATEFFAAGDEHQRFWELYPDRYASYVRGCGRAHRLSMLWGSAR